MASKVNQIFIDKSGSTFNDYYYWTNVGEILNEFHDDDTEFYMWDTECIQTSKDNIVFGGGHAPNAFLVPLFDKLKDGKNIIIITDGTKCFYNIEWYRHHLQNKNFQHVSIHAININKEKINSTVAQVFIERYPYTIIENRVRIARLNEHIDLSCLDKYENNIPLFLEEYNSILAELYSKCISNHDIGVAERLKKLKTHYRDIQSRIANDNKHAIIKMLRESLKRPPIRQYDAYSYFKGQNKVSVLAKLKDIEYKIDKLIHICTLSVGNYSLSLLKNNEYEMGTENEMDTENENQMGDGTDQMKKMKENEACFDCDDAFEVDIPILLVADGPGVFDNVPFDEILKYKQDPFSILHSNTLKNAILKRLDTCIGGKTFAEAAEIILYDKCISPYTKRIVSSYFSIFNDKAIDYATHNILFGDYRYGDTNMWLCVLYFILMERYDRFGSFIPHFQKYLIQRLQNRTTMASITSFIVTPFIKLPYDICLWYIVHAPLLGCAKGEANRLWANRKNIKYIFELVHLFGYSAHIEKIETLVTFYNAFEWMMTRAKEDKHWDVVIRAIYQNSMIANGRIILLDGPADFDTYRKVLPKPLQKLTKTQIWRLYKCVDPKKKLNDILLNIEDIDEPCEFPRHIVGYGYNDSRDLKYSPVPICPNTMRPYVHDLKTKRHWREEVEHIYGCSHQKMFSTNEHYIKYVKKYNVYPSVDDLIVYCFKKQLDMEYYPHTLPKDMLLFATAVVEEYNRVIQSHKIDVKAFVKRANKSWNWATRASME